MAKQGRRVLWLAAGLVALLIVAGVLYPRGWFSLQENEVIEPSTCPVCGKTVPFKTRKGRKHAECPSCGAYERHRLLFHFLDTQGFLSAGTRMLHFAPNRGIETQLRKRGDLEYRTADLFAPADLKLDLTAMDQPDASWDLIVCYHVLEHVDDDRKAMAEMFRVLAPGGRAVLQVPLEPGREETYEDPTIVDPKARLEAFGQEDHVRLYGVTDFRRRLEGAGFEVDAVDHAAAVGPDVARAHRLLRTDPDADERIWVARKP